MTKPCTNTTCGSYNPSLKNNCRHGFTDFKTFDCLGYVAEEDKEVTKNIDPCNTKCCYFHHTGYDLSCSSWDEKTPYTCKNYTQHPYDKIIDRMEGEVPKNGK